VSQAFAITMPAKDQTMTVKAALYYRSMPDELAKAVGMPNPVTTMASSESQVFGSAEAMSEAAKPQSEGGVSQLAVYAILGMAALFGLVALFAIRSRRPVR
jgi:hypothetical protein